MPAKRPLTYAAAGVSIEEAGRATSKIKSLAQRTFDRRVLTGIGAFGAAYDIGKLGLKRPVLISSADGVGTKLMVAVAMNVHHTVGQDLVNHCVNDIAVQGARPLFFLDYFATGKLHAAVAAKVVKGLCIACRENDCALIGGETAEMPGMYRPGEYDLAGFIVGAAERSELVSPKKMREGDVLLGLPSNGLHTNGYSLARKLLFDVAGHKPADRIARLKRSIGRELLRVHRSYLKPLRALIGDNLLHGAAHITGGGISDNTPRMLPAGLAARVETGSWPHLPIFDYLRELGQLSDTVAYQTFNMGLGLIVAVGSRSKTRALRLLEDIGEPAYVIGKVVRGRKRVIYT